MKALAKYHKIILLGEQRHIGVNNLPKVVARQCISWESNPLPFILFLLFTFIRCVCHLSLNITWLDLTWLDLTPAWWCSGQLIYQCTLLWVKMSINRHQHSHTKVRNAAPEHLWYLAISASAKTFWSPNFVRPSPNINFVNMNRLQGCDVYRLYK